MIAVQDEQELAYMEVGHWEELQAAVKHAISQLEESRCDTINDTGNGLTPEYNKVEQMLSNVMDYIRGRIEELSPGTYQHKQTTFYYASEREREAMRYALQEGINYVALTGLYPVSRRIDAIEYISERGLSSQNYEKTCQAVREYQKEGQKIPLTLDVTITER